MAEPHYEYKSMAARTIAELIDHNAAMKICLAFGGKRLRIPIGAKSESKLSEVVGDEAAEVLIRELGDEVLYIYHERPLVARWLFENGENKTNIAHIMKATRRQIQYWINDNSPRDMRFADDVQ